MNRTRVLLPLLLIILFAVAFLFWNDRDLLTGGNSPVAPSQTPATSAPPIETADGALTEVDLANTAAVTSSNDFRIDDTNQKIIAACLAKDADIPRVNFTDGLTLSDVLHDVSGGVRGNTSNVMINLEIKKADGRLQRLHLGPHDDGKKNDPNRWPIGDSDARVFDVDAEGLPVAVAFPRELQLPSPKNMLDVFSSGGQVTFRERRQHESYANKLSADVVETDGHITEFQLFFGASSLGCAWQKAQLACKCM